MAPVDRAAQRLLPPRQVAGPSLEQLQAVRQAAQHGLGREDPRLGGGQLQGQREPVEARAQLGHRGGVLGREREGGMDGLGPLDEQRDRRALGEGLGRRELRGIGQLERGDREAVLAVEPQDLPAGDHDGRSRAGGQQLADHRRRVQHLLEVVQHQQGLRLRGCAGRRSRSESDAPSAPMARAMVTATRAASVSGASGTKNTPPVKCPAQLAAASSASRVLPVPPGPVNVRSRTSLPARRRSISSSSRRRPIRRVRRAGSAAARRGPGRGLRQCPARRAQLVEQASGRGVSFGGRPRQAARHRLHEGGRKIGTRLRQGTKVALQRGGQRFERRAAREGPGAGRHLVEHGAQGELVGAQVSRLSRHHFRGQVAGRSQERPGARGRRAVLLASSRRKRARPKSRIFAIPCGVTSTFSGLRSPCTICRSCAADQAVGQLDRQVQQQLGRRESGRHHARRLSPSTSSITM